MSRKKKLVIGSILVSPTVLAFLVSTYSNGGWVEFVGTIFVLALLAGILFIIDGLTS